MPSNWTPREVQAILIDYFEMLKYELQSVSYNKSEYARTLIPKLNNRSRSSIEYKHQNVSAALIDLGLPYISGYKPMRNYQSVLRDEILNYLESDPDVLEKVKSDIMREVELPTVDDILAVLVKAPSKSKPVPSQVRDGFTTYKTVIRKNYLLQEAQNKTLGSRGEEFIMRFEQARLIKSGKENLASRVERVSESRGDGSGFDILSFEKDSSERFIEVKTTKYGSETPFYITLNEVQFSNTFSSQYYLYRLFDFRKKPKLFRLHGDVSTNCQLEATTFLARL